MSKYAAGGSMDKISNTKKQNNRNLVTRIIQITLVVIVLFLIFGGNLSKQPIMIYYQSFDRNQDTNEVEINFIMKNTTLSFLFNPYYKIECEDDAGKIIYRETVKAANIFKPRESINIHKVIPAIDGNIAKWTIGGHYQMFRPY